MAIRNTGIAPIDETRDALLLKGDHDVGQAIISVHKNEIFMCWPRCQQFIKHGEHRSPLAPSAEIVFVDKPERDTLPHSFDRHIQPVVEWALVSVN